MLKLAKLGRTKTGTQVPTEADYADLVSACITSQTMVAEVNIPIRRLRAERRYAIGLECHRLMSRFKVRLADVIKHLEAAGVCTVASDETKQTGVEPVTAGRLSTFRSAVKQFATIPQTDEEWAEFSTLCRPASKTAKPSPSKRYEATIRSVVRQAYELFGDTCGGKSDLLNAVIADVTRLGSEMLAE